MANKFEKENGKLKWKNEIQFKEKKRKKNGKSKKPKGFKRTEKDEKEDLPPHSLNVLQDCIFEYKSFIVTCSH